MNFWLDYVLPVGAFFLLIVAIMASAIMSFFSLAEGEHRRAIAFGVVAFVLFVILVAWAGYDLDRSIEEWQS